MTSSILQDALEGRAIMHTWTVDLYQRAIAEGWFAESAGFELLDGFIVRNDRATAGEDLLTTGDRHCRAVQRLLALAFLVEPLGCTMQVQQPVQLPPKDQPVPDGCVLRRPGEYGDGPRGARDIACVIEVSDNSLARDLGLKLRAYAGAGIEQYVVVDLVHDLVIDHRQPRGDAYGDVTTVQTGQTVQLRTASAAVTVPMERLLP